MNTDQSRRQQRSETTLTITNRFQAPPEILGSSGFGEWSLFTWDNQGAIQHGARLVSQVAPWRELFAALDQAGSDLSGEPVTLRDEADAIVGCCWRYGSYMHLLASGELYPEFARDPELSRLGDSEMMRINLEFSSGLAIWLAERTTDPAKVNRRVRAALRLLPMPWRDQSEYADIEVDTAPFWLRMQEGVSQSATARDWPLPTLREEANTAVIFAYRNGPIENYHSGMWSHGREVPGFKRFYAAEIKRLGVEIAKNMRIHLDGRQQKDDSYLRFGLRAFSMGSGSNWSLTEETSSIDYPGMPNLGPLGDRLCWLAERCPAVYSRISASTKPAS